MNDSPKAGQTLAERILDAVPLLVYVFDVREQRMTYINNSAPHLIGYAPQEYYEHGSALTLRTLHPDDQSRFVAHVARLAKGDEDAHQDFEYRLRVSDGSWRWFRSRDCVLSRDEKGDIVSILGIAEDITDRQELEEERERLISIIEATGDLVSIVRPDGSVVYANRAGRELVGVAPDADVSTVNIANHHSPEVTARIFEEIWPAVIRDGSVRVELPLRHTSGREIPVSVVIAAHRGDDGELEYLSCIMRDMTDERRTAEEIRRREDDLHERVAQREAQQRAASRELDDLPRALAGSLEGAIAAVHAAVERVRAEHAAEIGDGAGRELDGIAEAANRLEALAETLARPSGR